MHAMKIIIALLLLPSCSFEVQPFESGEKELKAGNHAEAIALFEVACKRNDMRGCNALGELEFQNGNLARAETNFKRACFASVWAGCYNYGRFLWERGDKGEAKLYYKKACEAGEARACAAISHGAAGDSQQARQQSKQACEMGIQKECAALGKMEEDAHSQHAGKNPGPFTPGPEHNPGMDFDAGFPGLSQERHEPFIPNPDKWK